MDWMKSMAVRSNNLNAEGIGYVREKNGKTPAKTATKLHTIVMRNLVRAFENEAGMVVLVHLKVSEQQCLQFQCKDLLSQW